MLSFLPLLPGPWMGLTMGEGALGTKKPARSRLFILTKTVLEGPDYRASGSFSMKDFTSRSGAFGLPKPRRPC